MGPRSPDLIPPAQKAYGLCASLYSYVDRFPRAQRGLLGFNSLRWSDLDLMVTCGGG
jgi:hypothetical protein